MGVDWDALYVKAEKLEREMEAKRKEKEHKDSHLKAVYAATFPEERTLDEFLSLVQYLKWEVDIESCGSWLWKDNVIVARHVIDHARVLDKGCRVQVDSSRVLERLAKFGLIVPCQVEADLTCLAFDGLRGGSLEHVQESPLTNSMFVWKYWSYRVVEDWDRLLERWD